MFMLCDNCSLYRLYSKWMTRILPAVENDLDGEIVLVGLVVNADVVIRLICTCLE